MKTYVTFGFDHKHIVGGKELDKDCVAVINSGSAEEGRKIAFELFGPKFCFEYSEDHFDFDSMHYFPRGFIEVNLLRCPCGKIPEELVIVGSGLSSKWANVFGDCCGEWMIEFRSAYNDHDSEECMALATAAWNDAPRYHDEWQPIDTAPKDGTHIMLYQPGNQFIGFYGGNSSGWRINAPGLPAAYPLPTNWKPLSQNPTDSNG